MPRRKVLSRRLNARSGSPGRVPPQRVRAKEQEKATGRGIGSATISAAAKRSG
ncbi:hypothetical protein LJK87_26055 [Paenibacillus sp. P25]|nr:hypothetical protein LJK87_26055 [Paenibacillus sp. P25]